MSINKTILSWVKGHIPITYKGVTLTDNDIEIFKQNLQRDNCFYCNRKFDKNRRDLIRTIDHIIPVSQYRDSRRSASIPTNKNHFTNVVVACAYCNEVRGNMDFFDFCDFLDEHIQEMDYKKIYASVSHNKAKCPTRYGVMKSYAIGKMSSFICT